MNAGEPFLAAYGVLMATLEVAGGGDLPEQANRAFSDYVALLEQASRDETMRRALDAFDDYQRVLSDGFGAARSRARVSDGFATYVHALRDAWAAADVSSIDPKLLMNIADSVRHAALVALAGTEGARETITREGAGEQGNATWGSTSALGGVESGRSHR